MQTRRNLGRILAVIATTAAATGIGFGLSPTPQHGGLPDSPFATSLSGVRVDWEAVARRGGAARGVRAQSNKDEHDLSALTLVSRVMYLVQENYVDPERVEPREMLLGALDYIEKRIPEVLVDDRDSTETGKVTLTVNRATSTIELSGLNSVWDLAPRLRQAFTFIQENLVTTEDTRRIEYAAINGMLSTLDPHSNLLDPEQYNDMKMQTRGEFGGLGFVVSMRDSRLTVMRIIPNTPAHQGGVQSRDVITRIEDDSTVNMDLNDAVSRLRGKPGTPVNFWVERAGLGEQRQFTLVRAIIEIDSIDPARLLADSVGYVRVTNFQGHTTRDLRKSIVKLQDEANGQLKGLVLDLRGNPGGLLEQAIQVADLFIERGTLVSTVGMNNRLRERKTATRSGTLGNLPLIVLVSNTSASASEIVSGAVRNLDRGLVLGSSTFGKGSVQVLYDLVDESALKLTIAQYLTPGDVSIQDLGIVPDIELVPSLVSKNRVMVFAPRRSLREQDLELLGKDSAAESVAPVFSLDPFATRRVDEKDAGMQPLATVTFLRDDVPDDEEIDEFEEPEWEEDFHVELARTILARAGRPTRRAMLERAKEVIDERGAGERRRIYEAISELGIDWSPSPTKLEEAARQVGVEASLRFDGPSIAGSETHLSLTLTNTSDQALHRVRAWTESASPRTMRHSYLFDRLEFLFGKLEPGQTRTWRVPVQLPSDLAARRELVNIRVEAEGTGGALPPIESILDVEEMPRPEFAFTWQVTSSTAAEDGKLPIGESAEIDIFVQNIGVGAAKEAVATIKNLEDQNVYITRGRHRVGELEAGAVGSARMTLEVKEGFTKDEIRARVTILDRELAQFVSDEIVIPVARERAAAAQVSGAVRLRSDTSIRAWAGEDAGALAVARSGATLPAEARVGDMYRVAWAEGRSGFVPATAVRPLPRTRRGASGDITPVFSHKAPRIILDAGTRAPVTAEEHFTLSGVTEGTDGLRDIYIFINNDKVFFRAWEPEAPPSGGEAQGVTGSALVSGSAQTVEGVTRRITFSTRLPLQEGANSVVIVARKSDELQSREQLVVFRTPSSLASSQKVEPGRSSEAPTPETSPDVATEGGPPESAPEVPGQ